MSVGQIGANAVEDGVEDYFSSYMFNRMKMITDPLKKKFDSGSEFDEAMNSFINTLSMGLAIYSLTKVMEFMFERSGKVLSAMFTYIVLGKVRKAIANKIKTEKFKGKAGYKYVAAILGTDRTGERIEMMKIAQSNIDSFDKHKFHYENQNMSLKKQMDSFSSGIGGYKGSNDLKTVTLFTDYTFRGAWKNTLEHKRIYEKATGHKLLKTGSVKWSKLYLELNKHTSFAKTANGEINNIADSINKLVAAKG